VTSRQLRISVWFDWRLIYENEAPLDQDRLETNRTSGARFFAYGDEMGTATANDRAKFGTYNRDAWLWRCWDGQ
jgi:hypothetical protein